jgi:hypothetical protein
MESSFWPEELTRLAQELRTGDKLIQCATPQQLAETPCLLKPLGHTHRCDDGQVNWEWTSRLETRQALRHDTFHRIFAHAGTSQSQMGLESRMYIPPGNDPTLPIMAMVEHCRRYFSPLYSVLMYGPDEANAQFFIAAPIRLLYMHDRLHREMV